MKLMDEKKISVDEIDIFELTSWHSTRLLA